MRITSSHRLFGLPEWIQVPRTKTYQAESDQKDKMRHAMEDDNGVPSKEIHERHREHAITAEAKLVEIHDLQLETLTPICWDEVGERLIEGPELIEITNEKVAVAKEKLKEDRSRQKSYADKHRRDLEFQVGDRVFLKVSPFRGVKRFGIKGKLSPRFIGPFEILERIEEVSYRLALPPQLSHVHDVLHVSLLRGCHYHPLHVASYPFDQIQPDMSLSEEPESILDRQERAMRNKVIPFVKIIWKNHPKREATWETEESMRASYPHFFV
ncbi:putative nucleotidyltransferase, ribonuclease H [Tanacetum coccineum]